MPGQNFGCTKMNMHNGHEYRSWKFPKKCEIYTYNLTFLGELFFLLSMYIVWKNKYHVINMRERHPRITPQHWNEIRDFLIFYWIKGKELQGVTKHFHLHKPNFSSCCHVFFFPPKYWHLPEVSPLPIKFLSHPQLQVLEKTYPANLVWCWSCMRACCPLAHCSGGFHTMCVRI